MPRFNSYQTKNKFNVQQICQERSPLKDGYGDNLVYSGIDHGLDIVGSAFLGAVDNCYKNFLYINEGIKI